MLPAGRSSDVTEGYLEDTVDSSFFLLVLQIDFYHSLVLYHQDYEGASERFSDGLKFDPGNAEIEHALRYPICLFDYTMLFLTKTLHFLANLLGSCPCVQLVKILTFSLGKQLHVLLSSNAICSMLITPCLQREFGNQVEWDFRRNTMLKLGFTHR